MKDIFIIIVLILVNGLFSMAETALISARKSRLTQEAKQGSRAARTALNIANNPDTFLSTIQIGITLIGILTGLYSGATFADALSEILIGWGVPAAYAHQAAQIGIVVIVTYLSIVVGELVPKRIALNSADSIAKLVARPMGLLSKISMPLVWLLSVSTNGIVRLLNLRDDENKTTEGDVLQIIENGAASGEVQEVEKDIMNRTLMLGDQRVASIMTSRKDVVALTEDMTAEEIKNRLAEELHDTYPVVDAEGDDVLGVVSLKNLVFSINDPNFKLSAIIQPGTYVPESATVYGALERLRTERVHSLIVCDEFGVMQGLMTLNDVLDGLVGSSDEDQPTPYIVRREDGSYLVDGQCPVYDFLAYFDCTDLYTPNNNYATIAGLILEHLRRLPAEGQKLTWHRFNFEIVDMDRLRIDKVLVTHLPA